MEGKLWKSLETIRKIEQGGSRAFGTDFLIVFNKKPQGKGRREDPELSGVISLLFSIRNHKEKGGGRIQSSPGQLPYCV